MHGKIQEYTFQIETPRHYDLAYPPYAIHEVVGLVGHRSLDLKVRVFDHRCARCKKDLGTDWTLLTRGAAAYLFCGDCSSATSVALDALLAG